MAGKQSKKKNKKKYTYRSVVYPGSFDPFTLGHLDIVERLSRMFDEVIIAVGVSSKKQTVFTPNERLDMISKSCKHIRNKRCEFFDTLMVDYAANQATGTIARGIRNDSDYQFEIHLSQINRNLDKEMDFIFLPTKQELMHISSTYVKEIASFQGDISNLVPKAIAAAVAEKYR